MGSRQTHHHHHAPPGPSLQERLTNAQNKINSEQREQERFLALHQQRNNEFALQMNQSNQEMAQTMAFLNSEHAKADTQRSNELKVITDQIEAQIRELDEKINNLEREKVTCATEIRKFQDISAIVKQKCDLYNQNKKEEESLLQKELEKVIQQHEDLVTKTEKTQEDWINSPALTNESVRRCAALSAELLWLPQQGVNDSNLFATLSANLINFLDTLSPFVTLMDIKLKEPSLQSANHEQTMRWLQEKGVTFPLLLQIVQENQLTMSDLLEILANPEELEDIKNVPIFHQKKVNRLLKQAVEDDQQSHTDFKNYLEDFAAASCRILVWKEVADTTSREIINGRLSAPPDVKRLTLEN